jgi:hypothetical protein
LSTLALCVLSMGVKLTGLKSPVGIPEHSNMKETTI